MKNLQETVKIDELKFEISKNTNFFPLKNSLVAATRILDFFTEKINIFQVYLT